MAALDIPSGGFQLTPAAKEKATADEASSTILRLDLLQEKTKDILNYLRAGKSVHLHTGKQPAIQYGEHRIRLQSSPDTFPSEIYSKLKGGGDKLYFAGKVSHTLESQRARQDTAKADEALATLQNSLKSIKEERALNESSFVGSRDELKRLNQDSRPSPLLGAKNEFLSARSIPGSPAVNATNSPRTIPTSVPHSGSSTKDKIRLEAIKLPLLHLLASRPMSPKAVAEKLRAPREDCERLLDKYARDCQALPGKKELRDKSYRELDVWKFPYPDAETRQAAIDRAIHAYDRVRIDRNDQVWQLLLPKADRGKGKVLSKLNFDRPAPTLKPPKTDGKGEGSDAEGKAQRKVSEKRKAEAEHESPNKKVKAASPAIKKRDVKAGRSSMPETKIKSSEKIEDSDEEAETVPVATAKTDNGPVKKQPKSSAPPTSVKQAVSSPSHKPLDQVKLLKSSSAGNEKDVKQHSLSAESASKEPLAPKQASRPRHGSSPQKPSPLGSSPPTNSEDTENSSTGKEASQSSAPSSPPSSTEMPSSKQRNKYSPVIGNGQRDVSRGRSTVKRKSDEHGEGSAPKRQQVNGVHQSSKLANGITEKPPLARQISESERSSSPEKAGRVKEEVMDDAKRFQAYYKKYKEKHERLSKIPEKDRDQKEIDDVVKMHKRLSEMKAEIWDNWAKVEKSSG